MRKIFHKSHRVSISSLNPSRHLFFKSQTVQIRSFPFLGSQAKRSCSTFPTFTPCTKSKQQETSCVTELATAIPCSWQQLQDVPTPGPQPIITCCVPLISAGWPTVWRHEELEFICYQPLINHKLVLKSWRSTDCFQQWHPEEMLVPTEQTTTNQAQNCHRQKKSKVELREFSDFISNVWKLSANSEMKVSALLYSRVEN